MTISIALPIAGAVIGYGARGVLGVAPRHESDPNCLDAVDVPIAVLFEKTLVPATAHHIGPGWVIIPTYNPKLKLR